MDDTVRWPKSVSPSATLSALEKNSISTCTVLTSLPVLEVLMPVTISMVLMLPSSSPDC